MQEQTYALCITYKDNNNEMHSITLDAVSDNTVQISNSITTHPLVSGDYTADHMFKNPISLSFSGSIANKGHAGVYVDLQTPSIMDFQKLLLEIRSEGYLCGIVKLITTKKDDVRFSTYSNMVIQSMSFVESINTMNFTISFQQVMLVNVQTFDVDTDDEYLPNIYEPETKSFTDTLMDTNQVVKSVVDYLSSADLIADGFLTAFTSLASTGVAVGVGAGLVLAIAAKLAIVASVSRIAAVAVVVVVFALGITNLIKRFITAYRTGIKPFKLYKNASKQEDEYKRFATLLDGIYTQLEQMNDVIRVYQLASDDEQRCVLSINDEYYTFEFKMNNITHDATCEIFDFNDASKGKLLSIKSCSNSYADLTTDNSICRLGTSYVHMLNISEENDFKLSSCLIIISDIDPQEYDDMILSIIRTALRI